jgi:hypothetical protein
VAQREEWWLIERCGGSKGGVVAHREVWWLEGGVVAHREV